MVKKLMKAHERKAKRSSRRGMQRAAKKGGGGQVLAMRDVSDIPKLWPYKDQILHELEEKKAGSRLGKTLDDVRRDAAQRESVFEQAHTAADAADHTRRAFMRDFRRLVTEADVLVEVLDARDPLGCRCRAVEQAIATHKGGKRLILLLNKIDLVPREVASAWLAHLRHEYPTVAFKSATSASRSGRISHGLADGAGGGGGVSSAPASVCLGADVLMQILKQMARRSGTSGGAGGASVSATIVVGVFGYPNVGKSSVINSLKRQRSVAVGARPGVTRALQEVALEKHIKLIDSPGIVFQSDAAASTAAAVLSNAIDIARIPDPVVPVAQLIERCDAAQLQERYGIGDVRTSTPRVRTPTHCPQFSDVDSFLLAVADARKMVTFGGRPNLDKAARAVLRDWHEGRIAYYTMPPEEPAVEKGAAQIVGTWAAEFDMAALERQERTGMDTLPTLEESGGRFVTMRPGELDDRETALMLDEDQDDAADSEEGTAAMALGDQDDQEVEARHAAMFGGGGGVAAKPRTGQAGRRRTRSTPVDPGAPLAGRVDGLTRGAAAAAAAERVEQALNPQVGKARRAEAKRRRRARQRAAAGAGAAGGEGMAEEYDFATDFRM